MSNRYLVSVTAIQAPSHPSRKDMQPKRPKKKQFASALPSITLFEPLRSHKPTRNHVPLDELQPILPSDIPKSPPKPRSPCRPIDKVTTALGFKATHHSHRVVIRPLFEDRKELEAEIAQRLLEQRDEEEEQGHDLISNSYVLHESQDIFQARVLQPLEASIASPPPLQSANSVGSFKIESKSTTHLRAQMSTASFSDVSETSTRVVRRENIRERAQAIEESHHHVIFMVQEQVLKTNKRQSLQSSSSVASIRRPFQKILHVETRLIPLEMSCGIECSISVSLLSSGEAIVCLGERAKVDKRPMIETQTRTLTETEAMKLFAADDIEVYSPQWAMRVCGLVSIDTDRKLVLELAPHQQLTVLTLHQDIPLLSEPVHVQAIAVTNGLCIAAKLSTSSIQHALIRTNELERVILRMDNMNVSEEHIRQLSAQKAWCAMFLHGLPLVQLMIEQYLIEPHQEVSIEITSIHQETSDDDNLTQPTNLDAIERLSSCSTPTPLPYVEESFASDELNNVRHVAQTLAKIALENTILWLQKQEAAVLYSRLYIHAQSPQKRKLILSSDGIISQYQSREYERRAILLLLDEMVLQFLHYECRVELHVAKADGGYNDYIATRIQSAFRMSLERRKYTLHQRVRNSAAKLVQTLQRGISARKRYIEKKLERERYLYFGFRSSLVTQSKLDNPIARLQQRTAIIEARRIAFLMGVVTGAHLFNKPLATPSTTLPTADVISLLNTHAAEVGCPPNLGTLLQHALTHSIHSEVVSVHNIRNALVAILRTLGDDTFGRPQTTKSLTNLTIEEPPRWLLKATPSLHASNLSRLVAEKLARIQTGKQSAYLVACHYRSIHQSWNFEKCRFQWHKEMIDRYEETCIIAQFTVDELVCWGMEKLQEAVKLWGWDGEAMFETFNVYLSHRFGKESIRHLELKFNEFAIAMNNRAKKVEIHPLRDEINEELQGFEKLLALRCLNYGYDEHITPASDILHVLLHSSSINADNLRIALPSVLPVATYLEKVEMAKRLLKDYASDLYGHGLVLLLWSCLDAAENATLEAGQLFEKLSKSQPDHLSPLAKALELLTGSHLFRLLEFCMKVSPLNELVRDIVRLHLEPYVKVDNAGSIKLESCRICMTICHMTDGVARRRLITSRLCHKVLRQENEFWSTYERLFGEMDKGYAQVSMETPN